MKRGIAVTLPCCRSVRRYRGKTLVFEKPLFTGYVFLELTLSERNVVMQSDYVAALLEVTDQERFATQLGDILRALDCGVELRLGAFIRDGSSVRIRSGPLRGLEGLVTGTSGSVFVLLRLDFIGRAAALRIDAAELEPS